MTPPVVGAIAIALAVTCLFLMPVAGPPTFGGTIAHPERSSLRDAGWTRSVHEWEGLRLIVAVCGLIVAGGFGVLPIGLLGAVVPSVVLQARAARGRDERARRIVLVLQTVVAGLRSGAGLTEAVRLAAASEAGTSTPLRTALRAFDLGAPLESAMRDTRASARDRRVILGLDALSLCVAEQLPASRCISLLGSVVDRLVFEQHTADDVRARTSGLRLQIILLAALVPSLAIYLAVTVPGLAETLSTPLGRYVLVPAAAVLETAGIFASRRVAADIS